MRTQRPACKSLTHSLRQRENVSLSEMRLDALRISATAGLEGGIVDVTAKRDDN